MKAKPEPITPILPSLSQPSLKPKPSLSLSQAYDSTACPRGGMETGILKLRNALAAEAAEPNLLIL